MALWTSAIDSTRFKIPKSSLNVYPEAYFFSTPGSTFGGQLYRQTSGAAAISGSPFFTDPYTAPASGITTNCMLRPLSGSDSPSRMEWARCEFDPPAAYATGLYDTAVLQTDGAALLHRRDFGVGNALGGSIHRIQTGAFDGFILASPARSPIFGVLPSTWYMPLAYLTSASNGANPISLGSFSLVNIVGFTNTFAYCSLMIGNMYYFIMQQSSNYYFVQVDVNNPSSLASPTFKLMFLPSDSNGVNMPPRGLAITPAGLFVILFQSPTIAGGVAVGQLNPANGQVTLFSNFGVSPLPVPASGNNSNGWWGLLPEFNVDGFTESYTSFCLNVGTASSTSSTTAPLSRLIWTAPPIISASTVTPSTGPVSGGTNVIIFGAGFLGTVAVYFGTNPATNVLANGPGTQINCTVPAAPGPGAVNVSIVASSAGTATINNGFLYTISPPPPPSGIGITQVIPALVQAGVPVTGVQVIGFGFTSQALNFISFTTFLGAVNLTPAEFTVTNTNLITIPNVVFPAIGTYTISIGNLSQTLASLDGAVVAVIGGATFKLNTNLAALNVPINLTVLLTGVPANQIKRVKFTLEGANALNVDNFIIIDPKTIQLPVLTFAIVGAWDLSLWGDTTDTAQVGDTLTAALTVSTSALVGMVISSLSPSTFQPGDLASGVHVLGKNFTSSAIDHIFLQSGSTKIDFVPARPSDTPSAGFSMVNDTDILLPDFTVTISGEYGITLEKITDRFPPIASGNISSFSILPNGVQLNVTFSTAGIQVNDYLSFISVLAGPVTHLFYGQVKQILGANSLLLYSNIDRNPFTGVAGIVGPITGAVNPITSIRAFSLNAMANLVSAANVLNVRDIFPPAIVFNPEEADFSGPFNLTIEAHKTDVNGNTLLALKPNTTIYFTIDGSKPTPSPSLLYSTPIAINAPTAVFAMAVDDSGNVSPLRLGFFNVGGLHDRLLMGFENLGLNYIMAGNTNDIVKSERILYTAQLEDDAVPGVTQVNQGWTSGNVNLLRDLRRGIYDILQVTGQSVAEVLAPPILQYQSSNRLRVVPGREIFTINGEVNRMAKTPSFPLTVAGSNISSSNLAFDTTLFFVNDFIQVVDQTRNNLIRNFWIRAIVNGNTVTVDTVNPDGRGSLGSGTYSSVRVFKVPDAGTDLPGNRGDIHHRVTRKGEESLAVAATLTNGTYEVWVAPSLVGHSYLDILLSSSGSPPVRAHLHLVGTFTFTSGAIVSGSISNVIDPVERPTYNNFSDYALTRADFFPTKDLHWREIEVALFNVTKPATINAIDNGVRINDPTVLPNFGDSPARPQQYMLPSNLSTTPTADTAAVLGSANGDAPRGPNSSSLNTSLTLTGVGSDSLSVPTPIGSYTLNVGNAGAQIAGDCTITINLSNGSIVVGGGDKGVSAGWAVNKTSGAPDDTWVAQSVGAQGVVFSGPGLTSASWTLGGFSILLSYPPPDSPAFGWSVGGSHGGVYSSGGGTNSQTSASNAIAFNGPDGQADSGKVLFHSGANLAGTTAVSGTLPPSTVAVPGYPGVTVPIDLTSAGVSVGVTGGTLTSKTANTITITTPAAASSAKSSSVAFTTTHADGSTSNMSKTQNIPGFILTTVQVTVSGTMTANVNSSTTRGPVPVSISYPAGSVGTLTLTVPVTKFTVAGTGQWKLNYDPALDTLWSPLAMMNNSAVILANSASRSYQPQDGASGVVNAGGSITLKFAPTAAAIGNVSDAQWTVFVNGVQSLGPV